MSGPIARFLAQALLIGGGVIVKAFAEAYQRVAANPEAARAAAEAAKKQGAKTGGLLRRQMAEREALMVLNLERRPQSREELRDRYRKYFEANDPKRGGSLYLQSKVYRANEALERAMGLSSEPVPPPSAAADANANANANANAKKDKRS